MEALRTSSLRTWQLWRLISFTVESIQRAPQPKTTPLLEALIAEKIAGKESREAAARAAKEKGADKVPGNITLLTSQKKGDDGKKKGPAAKQVPAQAQQVEKALPPMSKKSAKKLAAAQKHQATKGQLQGQGHPQPQMTVQTPALKNTPTAIKAKPKPAPTPATEAASAASTSASAGPSSTPAAGGPVPPAPRRGRPVLGAGMRGFEAALTGAGVSAKERKAKRDAEREASGAAPAGPASRPAGSGPTKETSVTPAGPVSPKKDRKKDTAAPALAPQSDVTDSGAGAAGRVARGGRGGGGGRGRGRGGAGRGGGAPAAAQARGGAPPT